MFLRTNIQNKSTRCWAINIFSNCKYKKKCKTSSFIKKYTIWSLQSVRCWLIFTILKSNFRIFTFRNVFKKITLKIQNILKLTTLIIIWRVFRKTFRTKFLKIIGITIWWHPVSVKALKQLASVNTVNHCQCFLFMFTLYILSTQLHFEDCVLRLHNINKINNVLV